MPKQTEGRIPLADLLVFHQLARSLTSSFDLDTILRTILEQMERMVEAELWALLMLDETSQDLYYAIAAGEEQEALRGLRVKVGEGVAGWVVAARRDADRSRGRRRSARETIRHSRHQRRQFRHCHAFARTQRHAGRDRDLQSARRDVRLQHRLPAHSGRSCGHRHRKRARRLPHPASHHHRRHHRALQRAPPLRGAGTRAEAIEKAEAAAKPGVPGSGPLQAGQRCARPPDRQRAARPRRSPAPGVEPQAGPVLPLRRRRIRDPDAGNRRRAGTGADQGDARGADGNPVPDEERAQAQGQRQRGPGLFARRWRCACTRSSAPPTRACTPSNATAAARCAPPEPSRSLEFES